MAGRPSIDYIAEPLQGLALPLSDLNPDAANARTHDQRNIDAIARSLSRWGQRQPIVVQKQGMIVRAGNGRLLAAKSLGWSHIAAIVVDEDSTEATAYAIADNRTAELAGWDDETLASLLQSLDEEDRIDAGFDDAELQALIDELTPAVEVEEDEAPEPPADPVTQPGDLWTLGRHRVLCGDATDKASGHRLWGDSPPFLMVTDPPYGVDYQGGEVNTKKRERLAGDKDANLYERVLQENPCEVVYLWFAGTKALPVYSAVASAGYEPRALLIWNKLKAGYGAPSAHYKQRHEPCVYARKGGSAKWNGDMTVPTVWDIEQPKKNEHHPTQKPIECMARPIRNHGGPGDTVYDPFLGSGTTLIAAEQLGRTCYGCEIAPAYCDVIVRRWENLTGEKATRVDAEGNEQPGLPDEGGDE